MGYILGLFFLIGLSLANHLESPGKEILQNFEQLSIVPRQKTLFSFLGIIPGWRQCGGSGKPLVSRNEACLYSQPGKACDFSAGRGHPGEITFVPQMSGQGLGAVAIVSDSQTGEELYKSPAPIWINTLVEAGKEYELHYNTAAVPETRGKTLKGQWLLYRASDKGLELCVEAIYHIV